MEYQPIKEKSAPRWPCGRDKQIVIIMFVLLLIIILLMWWLGTSAAAVVIPISTGSIIYIILLYNELIYLTKIYRMDIAQLEWDANNNEGMMRAKVAHAGVLGSVSGDSAINKTRMDGENNITRRKLKYQRDYLRSIILPISSLLKK